MTTHTEEIAFLVAAAAYDREVGLYSTGPTSMRTLWLLDIFRRAEEQLEKREESSFRDDPHPVLFDVLEELQETMENHLEQEVDSLPDLSEEGQELADSIEEELQREPSAREFSRAAYEVRRVGRNLEAAGSALEEDEFREGWLEAARACKERSRTLRQKATDIREGDGDGE